MLRETGLPPEVLEIEITENVALNYDEASVVLQRLRDKGVKLAFDDFGTGYASLSYLTRFPLSRIRFEPGARASSRSRIRAMSPGASSWVRISASMKRRKARSVGTRPADV